MAFRDDHAAALARADALQAELDRLQQQRPRAAPPEPQFFVDEKLERDQPATSSGPMIVVLSIVFVGFVGLLWFLAAREEADEDRDIHTAKVALAGCLDRLDAEIVRQRDKMPDRFDPKVDLVMPALRRPVALECTKLAVIIAGDGDLPAETRGILIHWDAAEHALDETLAKLADYYAHRDWEEDEMRGARTIWKRLEPLLAQRDAMVRWAREAALPVVTASE